MMDFPSKIGLLPTHANPTGRLKYATSPMELLKLTPRTARSGIHTAAVSTKIAAAIKGTGWGSVISPTEYMRLGELQMLV